MASEQYEQWAKSQAKVKCNMCRMDAKVFQCISCCECDASFHKTCVNPMRAVWPEGEEFMCEACFQVCAVCEDDEETDENPIIICDNCDYYFHLQCLDEDSRPPDDEIGDEDVEWYCPDCFADFASDNEWADEAIVPDAEMTKEECFTRSKCPCEFCEQTNSAVDTWKEWEPDNVIGKGMKDAIDQKEGLVNAIMEDLHHRHGLPPPE